MWKDRTHRQDPRHDRRAAHRRCSDVERLDDGGRTHVAEQRDLLALIDRDFAVGAAEQNVGLDADRAQFLDRMLGGLGLEFPTSPTPSRISSARQRRLTISCCSRRRHGGDIEGLRSSSDPSVWQEQPRRSDLYPFDALALYPDSGELKTQAHPAFGQGIALDRHSNPTFCSAAPTANPGQ